MVHMSILYYYLVNLKDIALDGWYTEQMESEERDNPVNSSGHAN